MAPLKKITKGLLASGLLFGVMGGVPAAEAAQEEAEHHESLINTSGTAEIRVSPDALRTTVGVEARERTLAKARNEVNTKAQQILQTLKALDIPGLTLQTEAVRVNPIFKEKTEPPKITGYSATNLISVTVRRATQTDLGEYASRIIDTALQSGANHVGDVDFFLEESKPAQDQALKAAVNDAAHNAQVIADAAGVRIIKLRSVDQGSGYEPTRLFYAAKSAEVGGPARTPIEVGKIVINSSVTASFVFAK